MKTKLLFNSILFLTAGIISILRTEVTGLIISFSFSLLFLTLTLWIGSRKNETIFE